MAFRKQMVCETMAEIQFSADPFKTMEYFCCDIQEERRYCESTLIHGYQFSWIREETQVHGFLNLWFSVYTSMGISYSLGTKFRALVYPRKPQKLVLHKQ